MKFSTPDWLAAAIVATQISLILAPLWLPHVPLFVQVPFAIIVIFGCLFCVASALRDRWRLSKTTGQFLGYYLALVAVAVPIIVAILLLVYVIGMFSVIGSRR